MPPATEIVTMQVWAIRYALASRLESCPTLLHQYQYQSKIYLARASFVIKTQSEARLHSRSRKS